MENLLGQLCGAPLRDRIWIQRIEPMLRERKAKAFAQLSVLMRSHHQFPICHNASYMQKLKEQKLMRLKAQFDTAVEAAKELRRKRNRTDFTFTFTNREAPVAPPPPMDNAGALPEDVLDQLGGHLYAEGGQEDAAFRSLISMDALYDVSLALTKPAQSSLIMHQIKRDVFVDNVNALVVEGELVRDIEEILSAKWLFRLDDAEILALAAEPKATREKRARLRKDLAGLQEAKRDIMKLVLED